VREKYKLLESETKGFEYMKKPPKLYCYWYNTGKFCHYIKITSIQQQQANESPNANDNTAVANAGSSVQNEQQAPAQEVTIWLWNF
jgi:hypothetical protein